MKAVFPTQMEVHTELSQVSQGPGWWIASDGKWYPPHLHPSVLNQITYSSGVPIATPTGIPRTTPGTTPASTSGATSGATSGKSQRIGLWMAFVAVLVIGLIGLGVFVLVSANSTPGTNLATSYYAKSTPPGKGFLCTIPKQQTATFLTWTLSGSSLQGVSLSSNAPTHPEHFKLNISGQQITIYQSGSSVRDVGTISGSSIVFYGQGHLSKTSLPIQTCNLVEASTWISYLQQHPPTPASELIAKSNLTDALTNANVIRSELGSYGTSGALAQALATQISDLTFTTGQTNLPEQISVATADGNELLILATASNTQTCWYALDNVTNHVEPLPGAPGPGIAPGVYYNESKQTSTAMTCSAQLLEPVTGPWAS